MAEIQMIPNWPSRPSEAASETPPPREAASDFALPALSYVRPQPVPTTDIAATPGDALTRWLETVLGLTAGIGEAADPAFAAMDAGLPQVDMPVAAPDDDPATMMDPTLQPADPSSILPKADISVLAQGTPPLPMAASPQQGASIATDDLPLPAQTPTPAAHSDAGRADAAASQPDQGMPQAARAPIDGAEKRSGPAMDAVTAMTRAQMPDRPAAASTDPTQRGGPGSMAPPPPQLQPRPRPGETQRVWGDGRTAPPPPAVLAPGAEVTAPSPAASGGDGAGDVGGAPGAIASHAQPAPPPEGDRPAPVPLPVPRDAAGKHPEVMTGAIEPGGSPEPVTLADVPRAGVLMSGASPHAPDTGQAPDPRPVIRQVTEALVTIRGERTEIALSPEELGRVRLIMTGPDRSHITIWAERPETLDLVRRNADLLTQQLAEAGVRTDSMSFRRDDRAGWPDGAPQRHGDDDDSPAPADATPVRLTPASLSDRRLDIRI